MTLVDNILRTEWPSFSIPGVRANPSVATYLVFPVDKHPVDVPLDDEFSWLSLQPIHSEWPISFRDEPDAERRRIAVVVSDLRYRLPSAFVYFLSHPELHRKVRSCTACYLELPDRVVETDGVEHGYLIHFLSDQQWVLNWYLYVNDSGDERVLCSRWRYGINDDEEPDWEDYDERCPARRDFDGLPDIATMELTICTHSFSEFVYRFWIENEIWWAKTGKLPLTAAQQKYLDRLRQGGKDCSSFRKS